MSDYGLIIAEDGGKIGDQPPRLTSLNQHLIVDLERTPSHLQLLDPLPQSAPVNSSDGAVHKQTLFPLKHGLGYTPFVICYFQLTAFSGAPGGFNYNSVVGGYSGDFYNIGGTGTVSDFFTFEADKSEVRIIQTTQDAAVVGYNSLGPYYKFRVKLYVCSIDTGKDLISGLDTLS